MRGTALNRVKKAKRLFRQPSDRSLFSLGEKMLVVFLGVYIVLCLTLVRSSGPYLEGAPGFVHFSVGALPPIAMFAGIIISGLRESRHSVWSVTTEVILLFISPLAWIAALSSTGKGWQQKSTVVPAADWYEYGSEAVRHASDLRGLGCIVGLFVIVPGLSVLLYIGFKVRVWVKKRKQPDIL